MQSDRRESIVKENFVSTIVEEEEQCIGSIVEQPTFSKNYQLVKKLGSGSFAEVWEGMRTNTGESVAIKILEGTDSNGDVKEILKQNESEIECLKQLSHPNIVNLYDIVIADDKVYLVQELATKGDLFDYMFGDDSICLVSGQGFCESDAQMYFYQLISAVHYMHTNGYAHRDIKIENCLITETGKLLLCDFGMATKQVKCDNRCGTLDYIAPEVLITEAKKNELKEKKQQQQQQQKSANTSASANKQTKKKNKNKNGNNKTKKSKVISPLDKSIQDEEEEELGFCPFIADVWSCGVFLFYILTSDLPFEDDSREVTKANILSGNISVPDYVSDCAKSLLFQMLQTDPSQRCSLDDVLNHPFLSEVEKSMTRLSRPASIGADELATEFSHLSMLQSSKSFNLGTQNA